MKSDPKKDPSRRCLPLTRWPDLDRGAWEKALCGGDILEPGGGGADWSEPSRTKIAKGYGRWLTWLQQRGWLGEQACPAARITSARVNAYVADLRLMNASYSVLARVQELYQAIRVMAPELDWTWLRGIEGMVRRGATASREKQLRVVPVASLYALGIELMTTAEDPACGTQLQRACQYRDGLMIAMLAARPLRRRNFARIQLDRHLIATAEGYWIRFEGSETKTGEPIEAPLPQTLAPYIATYLSEYRPVLLARDGRWNKAKLPGSQNNALWVSEHGSAMTEIAIYFRIRTRTQAHFGKPINPHLFRDCAATSVAIEDPEHVHIVRDILGHSTLQSGERYYIQARSLDASRRYQRHILQLRRRRRKRT